MNAFRTLLFGGPGTATKVGDVALLVLRVSIGVYIAAHGLGKVPVQQGFIDMTAALGFTFPPGPTFFAWSAALTELVGGLLLALGLLTRPVAWALVFNMGVAAFGAHLNDPFLAKPGEASKEMAILYLAPFLLFGVIGAGRLGVDAFLRRRRVEKHKAAA